MSKRILWSVVMALAVTFVSCKKDDDTTPEPTEPQYILLGNDQDQGYTLEIYAADSFFVGYNQIFIKIKDDSDALIDNAQILFFPEMDMGTMQHGCPIEEPEMDANSDNYFEGALIFQMGTMGMMGWTLEIEAVIGGTTYTFNYDIVVHNLDDARAKVVTLNNGMKLISSWVYPMEGEIGLNDMDLTMHQMVGPYDFQPITDFTVTMEPFMPSMGHGSPNNVNPIHVEGGHYEGIVNFTMTGHWEVKFELNDNQGTLQTDELFYDLRF